MVGEPIILSVAAEGEEPLAYVWYFERQVIKTAVDPILRIESADITNAGRYWVVASNKWGRVGSDQASIRIGFAREWTEDNGGNGHRYETVCLGGRENDWRAMFNNTRSSGGYLVSYHSKAEEDFVNTLAPIAMTRLIGLFQPADSHEPAEGWRWMSGEPLTYSNWATVEPNNGLRPDGSIINYRGFENLVGLNGDQTWNDIHGGSEGYIIEYPKDLVVYEQPTNTVVAGYEAVALRACAAAKSRLQYQWFGNNRLLPGQTGAVLPVPSNPSSPVVYFYTVTDGLTTLASASAEVRFGPLFVSSPTNTAVHEGEHVELSLSVQGPGPFTFQWYRNKVRLEDQNKQSLVISSAQISDTGSYWVEVSNTNAVVKSIPTEVLVLLPDDRLVLFEDFEQSSASGWSLPATTVAPSGGRRLLGEFGTESVTLLLTNLPIHDELMVKCDVIVRGFWEGNANPDTWSLLVDTQPIFKTSFSTYGPQAFPNDYPGGTNCAGADASEINTLGYECNFAGDYMVEDAIFKINKRLAHTGSRASIVFNAVKRVTGEAFWSLDNVAVVATSHTPIRLAIAPTVDSEQLLIEIVSTPRTRIILEDSTNMGQWHLFQTLTNNTGTKIVLVPFTTAEQSRFIRAAAEPLP